MQPSVPVAHTIPGRRLESATGADVAQLVERELPKLEVAGSKPVVRLSGRRTAGSPGRAGVILAPRMAAYSFLTTWCVDAPVQDVWDVISASDRYPEWWKGVRKVTELEPGGEHGLGALQRLEWRSKLPYSLEFDMRVTRSEPPYLLEGHASGELEGVGIWRLYDGAGGHRARLQLGRVDDARLDESPVAAGPAGLRLEPRLRHAPGGDRAGRAARRRARGP